MTNEQILYKSIEIARTNRSDLVQEGVLDCPIENTEYYKVIFNPNFAKAFWGEEDNKGYRCFCCNEFITGSDSCHCGNFIVRLPSKYHQHKMLDEVQAGKNPLKYLENFL